LDLMPFYLVFLQSMPESAIIVALGLALIGVKPRLLQLLLVAFITALFSYFIRALPLPPGINIILQFPIMVMLITYLVQIPISFAVLATSLGIICITLVEMIFNTSIPLITDISVMEAIANPFWRVLFPLPEFIFMIIVILGLNHYEKSLLNLPEYKEMEQVIKYEER